MRKLLYITLTLALLAAITSYAIWTRDRPGAQVVRPWTITGPDGVAGDGGKQGQGEGCLLYTSDAADE